MKPRSFFLPVGVLICTLAAFVWYVLNTSQSLPESVASHFDLTGNPNGWMLQPAYLQFMLVAGMGSGLWFVATFSIFRLLKGKGCNVPRREYWLTEERRPGVLRFIQRQGFWFACVHLGLFAALHHLILSANAHSPPFFPYREFYLVLGLYLLALLMWLVAFLIPFYRKPA